VMSMQKTSFTTAPKRKVVRTATMMQTPRTWYQQAMFTGTGTIIAMGHDEETTTMAVVAGAWPRLEAKNGVAPTTRSATAVSGRDARWGVHKTYVPR
jgi:hypothetical protein